MQTDKTRESECTALYENWHAFVPCTKSGRIERKREREREREIGNNRKRANKENKKSC